MHSSLSPVKDKGAKRCGKNLGIKGRLSWTSIYKNNTNIQQVRYLQHQALHATFFLDLAVKTEIGKKLTCTSWAFMAPTGCQLPCCTKTEPPACRAATVLEQGKVLCWQQREQQDSSNVLPAGTAYQHQLHSVRLVLTNKMKVQMVWECTTFSYKKGNPKDQRQMGPGPITESGSWGGSHALGQRSDTK